MTEPHATRAAGAYIDQVLRKRVDGDIAAFLAAFDAALADDTIESRAALREATDRLLRAGARTRIELDRLEARIPSPPRGSTPRLSFLSQEVQDVAAIRGASPIPSQRDAAGSSLPKGSSTQAGKAATGEIAAPDTKVAEGREARDEFTADYVPPMAVELSGKISSRSAAAAILAVDPRPEPDASTLSASIEQRPAAYRFELRDGKVDVLPEPPEPEDRDFALDTYRELVDKAGELQARLAGTNLPPRVRRNAERLLTALGTRFDDLRPGVLLSRSRSIEEDRAAFGDELSPDVIAIMGDTLRTLRDLLAAFPNVRRIEAEVLALDLDRVPDAVPTIREQMAAVKPRQRNRRLSQKRRSVPSRKTMRRSKMPLTRSWKGASSQTNC